MHHCRHSQCILHHGFTVYLPDFPQITLIRTFLLAVHLVEQSRVPPSLLHHAWQPVGDPHGQGVAVGVEVAGAAPRGDHVVAAGANAEDEHATRSWIEL